ncbi:hypothetical protein [Streptomyces sp. JHA26]|uniref:hypothetical protein n=1 Tax=Streptomyces sp. JHA26 TaxID=1917143 RepID=UPI00098B79CF|nr:hypothetical protein [Streptomyces sp. JHA26]
MSRLGRDRQRDRQRAERPIDVRVPEAGGDACGASVDGVPVVAAPGEEIRHAVLNRLHHFARTAGRPVLATIHDERIGCVVRLRVDPDGSSHLAGKPVPTPRTTRGVEGATADPADSADSADPADPAAPADSAAPAGSAAPADSAALVAPVAPADPVATVAPVDPASASAVSAVRSVPAAGTPAVPEPQPAPSGGSTPTFVLRALPVPAGGRAPGTVAPPTGVFGPPPSMDTPPGAPAPGGPVLGGAAVDVPARPAVVTGAFGDVTPASASTSDPAPAGRPEPGPDLAVNPESRPTPTPARGFDAVAEAVLGDAPLTAPGDATAPALLAEPTARVNEAVREGRTQDAARLAERAVAEASDTLGPEHPEVLRLRELTAYIAYLSGDPERAFRLSLDLAGIHRRAGDAEAAYGNVQSAATAWRAVRDPEQGLELGRDLVGLWSELAAEAGPAAEDAEQLESARTRMGRLAERARAHAHARAD